MHEILRLRLGMIFRNTFVVGKVKERLERFEQLEPFGSAAKWRSIHDTSEAENPF
jgi:hypothetical protein